MFKKILFVFTICLTVFILAGEAFAITIGPSRFEVVLPQGEVAVADYYVQNETEKPIHVTVEPENWSKEAYFYGDLKIEDWIEFDSYEFDLQPKEIKKLILTIKVPEDVTGELVAQIFFTSAVGTATGEEQTGGIRARIGAVLYVAIEGTESVDAEIVDVIPSKISDNGVKKIEFGVKVKNRGNVHIRPTGKVLIEDEKGEKVVEINLVQGRAVLPNKDNLFYVVLDKTKLKKGKYNITAVINYGKMFGEEKTADFKRSFEVTKSGEVK